jgi:hypothetical protein
MGPKGILGALSVLAVLAVNSICGAQTSAKTHTASQLTQRSTADAAMKSLVGRTIYTCHMSKYPDLRPDFQDGVYGNGDQIPDASLRNLFGSGDRLTITHAETDMATLTEYEDSQVHPQTYLTLRVRNTDNEVEASLKFAVHKSQVTPTRIMNAISDSLWFSAHPLSSDIRIGMTENDVYCSLGVPDHTNSDALGGDQLVYSDQQMYVYISPRTDRVTNVQTTY